MAKWNTNTACFLEASQAYEISDKLDEILPAEEEIYTHDYPELAKWDSHYLFVYGSLKKDFKRSRFLDQSPILGVGYTKVPLFTMYMMDRVIADKLNRLPVALMDGKSPRAAHLYGEVYQVHPDTIRSLDYVESNEVYYKRVKMPFQITDFRDGKEHQIYAWCYLGVKPFWEKKIDELTPCDLLKSNSKPNFKYYNYMKKYDQEAA